MQRFLTNWTRVATLLVACGALLACSSAQRVDLRSLAEACAPNTSPSVVRTVVVQIGRSNEVFVRRRFGDVFRREAGPGEGEERWTYDSHRLPFRSAGPPDHRQRWTIELLSCLAPSRIGVAEGLRLELRFDAHGRVAEMHVWRDYLPLMDDPEE